MFLCSTCGRLERNPQSDYCPQCGKRWDGETLSSRFEKLASQYDNGKALSDNALAVFCSRYKRTISAALKVYESEPRD